MQIHYLQKPNIRTIKIIAFNSMQITLFATCLFALQGCYHYRISSAHFDPSTSYSKKRVDSFMWGLVQKRNNGIDVVANNCDSLNVNSLDEVRVSTNFGYALITVITLGIWSPLKLEWKCAKPCAREGIIH